MKIVVDWELCESNGLCAAAAPELFMVSDDDKLEVLQDQPDPSEHAAAKAAARSCPKQAIALRD